MCIFIKTDAQTACKEELCVCIFLFVFLKRMHPGQVGSVVNCSLQRFSYIFASVFVCVFAYMYLSIYLHLYLCVYLHMYLSIYLYLYQHPKRVHPRWSSELDLDASKFATLVRMPPTFVFVVSFLASVFVYSFVFESTLAEDASLLVK